MALLVLKIGAAILDGVDMECEPSKKNAVLRPLKPDSAKTARANTARINTACIVCHLVLAAEIVRLWTRQFLAGR